MPQNDRPQIYLITPPIFELSVFPTLLGQVMDRVEVACLRLSLASQNSETIARSADCLREIAHQRDLALIIDHHVGLVEKLGLDGVHLPDGPRGVRSTRQDLGAESIIGAFCGASKHDGMLSGEAGADYVSFGPVGTTDLGGGAKAEKDLFAWWSEMIELPVVAEGALDQTMIETLAPITDFFAIGPEIWETDDPATTLEALTSPLR